MDFWQPPWYSVIHTASVNKVKSEEFLNYFHFHFLAAEHKYLKASVLYELKKGGNHWWQCVSEGYFSIGFKHMHSQAEAPSQGIEVQMLPYNILQIMLAFFYQIIKVRGSSCTGESL